MIYIKRFLWVLFFIPMFLIALIVFFLTIITYPFVGAFFYIKTGDVENISFAPYDFAQFIFNSYSKLEPKQ